MAGSSDRLALDPMSARLSPQQRLAARVAQLEQLAQDTRVPDPYVLHYNDVSFVNAAPAASGTQVLAADTLLAGSPAIVRLYAEITVDTPAGDGVNQPTLQLTCSVNASTYYTILRQFPAAWGAQSNLLFRSMPLPSSGNAPGTSLQTPYQPSVLTPGGAVYVAVPAGSVQCAWGFSWSQWGAGGWNVRNVVLSARLEH